MTVLDLAEHMERVRERQAFDAERQRMWDQAKASQELLVSLSQTHPALAPFRERPIGNHAGKTPVAAFIAKDAWANLDPSTQQILVGAYTNISETPGSRPEPTQSVPGTAATKKNRLLARRAEEALQ